MSIPDRLPMLKAGAHDPGSHEMCGMEAASWLANEEHSDHPECVHPVLAAVARSVNDSVDDETRQALWPLLIRCLGTASDDRTVSVRLAAWSAEQVLEYVAPSDWQVCRDAITAAQNWAENPCEETAHAAAVNAYAATTAAHAANAAAHAANAAAHAANAAANAAHAANAAAHAASVAANPNQKRMDLLSGLIDECRRILNLDEPTVTEDDWDRLIEFTDV